MSVIIITGSDGGIGRAISDYLKLYDYEIICIDKKLPDSPNNISFDLSKLNNKLEFEKLEIKIGSLLKSRKLFCLINNAAIQNLNSFENVTVDEFTNSLDVNLIAPFALSKICYKYLKQSKGHIINIGTIHTNLTKPTFISYATSKSGLVGLTKSLAVDIGNEVKVNMICPAAIKTSMLESGFENDKLKLEELINYHPSKSIGYPSDIAILIKSILQNNLDFMNGSIINIDGGISSRLHDPS